MSRLKDIPELARDSSNLASVMSAIREALQTFRGYRGDPLDTALTLRDATQRGLLLSNGQSGAVGLVGPGNAGWPLEGVSDIDTTPPPTADGLAVSAAISSIFVACAAPVYTQGHGHALTVVYGAKWPTGAIVPVFTDAVELFQFQGTFSAYASDPSTRWCIWIKWKSNDGFLSTAPAGGTNGVQVTTGQDVSKLLTALTGKIMASELHTALGARINLIDGAASMPGSVAARLLSESTARANDFASETNAWNSMSAWTVSASGNIAGNTASIINEQSARTTAISAEASARTTLAATVAGNTAAISTEATARATQTGELYAQYTIKLDVNGKVSGYGLASTGPNGVGSVFEVRADKFVIAAPAGAAAGYVPFAVLTAPTVIGGVTLPAGVYAQAAFIVDAQITNAKIANLAVDNAKIANLSAAKLTAGAIAVGATISSTGVYGGGGPMWSIDGAGNATFNNAVVRGTVYATAGAFSGDISAASGNFRGQITGGSYTGYAWPAAGLSGFYLGASGLLLGNYNNGKYLHVTASGDVYAPGFSIANGVSTFGGALSAATGSFAGSLNAASGTFAGSLTANAINAVSTINIGPNQVTIPMGNSAAVYGATVTITVTTTTKVICVASFYGQQISHFIAKILRGATVVAEGEGTSSGGIDPVLPITITGVDTISPGTHTYTVSGGGSTQHSTNTTLFIMAAMR